MTPGPNPALLIALTAMALAGCASRPPPAAAPPASIKPPNSQLEHCPRALGTLSFGAPDRPGTDAELSGSLPLLRLMVRASNCFALADARSAHSERILTPSDYTATSSLSFGDDGAVGRLGSLHDIALQPSTLLTLTDNRSGAALAVAQGSASHWRFGAAGGFFNGGFAGADGYTRTPQGKVLVAAMVDSYNQVVRSLRRHAALAGSAGLRPAQVARHDPPRSR
ncbi:hypothetical protein F2P45_12300 [Massilia sp. CCM 8733]|uniref:Peptidoglycan-binding protein n=1 Tax=Massilia mucilaginosa TaxID=2609282 RepID=A0ABX0NSP3_9BURK|nr:hypothetical protein [Massilia mucilaginosa]NHZ89788.1 hypothetical protein [Massilia mucilaginosa]